MSNQTFQWSRGKLSQGLSSVAQHLGLRPDEVVFINCLVVNPQGKCWELLTIDGLEFVVSGSVVGMCGPGATALLFPMSKSQRKYCDDYLEEGGRLREVPRSGDSGYYPEGSVVAALLKNSHDASIKDLLHGKVIANSYVTDDVEKLAQTFNGRTLMSSDTFSQFLGKEYLHRVAENVGMQVPPGIVVYKPDSSCRIIASLLKTLRSKGIDPNNTRVWIKPSSLSGGGKGIVCTRNATPESLKAGLLSLARNYHKAGLYPSTLKVSKLSEDHPFKDIFKFMPFLIEADVGQLPWATKKLDDVAVNAILGPRGVVHIESTPFSTKSGAYTGSRLPKADDEALVHEVEMSVDKLFQRMWKEGYRGYVGVDAMVVETHDGSLIAYVNDLNPRLCGATPLICMAHKVEAKLGYRPAVFSLTYKLRKPSDMTDSFEEIAKGIGKDLYRGAESGYTGIVPTLLFTPPDEDYFRFRAIAIGRDETHLRALRKTLDALDLFEDHYG